MAKRQADKNAAKSASKSPAKAPGKMKRGAAPTGPSHLDKSARGSTKSRGEVRTLTPRRTGGGR